MVGLRTGAPGMPIFWCGQGSGEFENLCALLPPGMPVYGTRSLYLFSGKTEQDEAALAWLLAHEIESLAAGRQLILGGFCAGGRIIMDAAVQLRQRGVSVKMIFLHETPPLRSIDVPVALGFSPDPASSPLQRFHRPEIHLAKRYHLAELYPEGWKTWISPAAHEEIYSPTGLPAEVEKVRALWDGRLAFEMASVPVQLPGTAIAPASPHGSTSVGSRPDGGVLSG